LPAAARLVHDGGPMRRFVLVCLACLGFAAPVAARGRTATGYVHGAKKRIKLVHVGGAEVEVHTAKAFARMYRAALKDGIHLRIRSAYRSYAKQAALYRRYRHGHGNLAARPGYSHHESGRALDLCVSDHRVYAWLAAHAAHYGFRRTVAGEAWHWEYVRGTERPEPHHHRHHHTRHTDA
jgi:hypothetical protein